MLHFSAVCGTLKRTCASYAVDMSKSLARTCTRSRKLGSEELKLAEHTLKGLFPDSLTVYGCLFNINRGKLHNWEVIADSWPEFKAMVCMPKRQSGLDYLDSEGDFPMCNIYAKDEESLKALLGTNDLLDWSQFTLLSGFNRKHLDAVRELAASKNTPTGRLVVTAVFILEDASHIKGPESNLACSLKPLTTAHAELVHTNWKYGLNKSTYNSVLSYISNFPSLCVTAEDGTPVSWILVDHQGAISLLHTLPEHRSKGYAQLLCTTMIRALLEQGRPAYGYVEEDNDASFNINKSLGGGIYPDYRAVWLELNPR